MTTKSTHTPGPWRVGDAGATVFGPTTDAPYPKTIATVSVAAVVGGENKANARLIACAPEMLLLIQREYAKGRISKKEADVIFAKVAGGNQ